MTAVSTTTPTTSTTLDRLRCLLMRDYQLDADRLGADAALDSLGIDSLGVAELLFTLEDEFSVTLPSAPVQLVTVGDVATFIDALLAMPCTREAG